MLNEEKMKMAEEKLKNSFGNKVLENLAIGEVKEVVELDNKLYFIVELRFKDNSAFAYYYAIEKSKIRWEDKNEY